MQPRRHRKICHQIAEFTGLTMLKPVQGQGYTFDLSTNGCRIETDTPVENRRYVSLVIDLAATSLYRSPVTIEVARVRWVKRHSFGVEFIKVSARNRQLLEAYVHKSGKEGAAHE